MRLKKPKLMNSPYCGRKTDSIKPRLEAVFLHILALFQVGQFLISSKSKYDKLGIPSQYL